MYPANGGVTASSPVKAWQVQVRAPDANATQKWLTTFDLSASANAVATASAITVTSDGAVGSLLASSSGNQAVLFSGAAGSSIGSSIAYSVPNIVTTHFITELPANSGYSVAAVVDGSNLDITVTPAGMLTISAKGVLSFTVSAAGIVGPGDRIFANGFGG